MKKVLATMLALVLLMGCMGGCANSNNTATSAASTASVSEADSSSKAEESTVDSSDSKAESTADGGEKVDISGKTVDVLIAYHEDVAKRQAEEFEKLTGCKVNFLRMPTGEAITKIVSEADNPTVTLLAGGTVDGHQQLKEQGLLTNGYTSYNEEYIPEAYADPEGYFKTLYIETVSIGVNTERWEEEFADSGLEMPTTLEELLDPAFKGEIIMPDPTTSGTGYTIISSILDSMGEDEGWKYLEALNEQIGQYTSSGYTPAEKTGLGEYLICVNFLADQLIVSNAGYPLHSTVFEGAGWCTVPVSILNGFEDDPCVQQFIDFLLSKEGMDILVELAPVVAVRNDVILPEGGSKLEDLPLNLEYNATEAGKLKADNVAKFTEMVG